MNILWHSNSSTAPSGYGNQTALFTRRLKNDSAADLSPVISAFYGAEGTPHLNADGILTLPRGVQPYGNDVIQAHFNHPHWPNQQPADLVLSLIDPFVLDPAVWGDLPWCAWTPVDSTPVFAGNARALKAARWVWSLSRFGQEQLRAAGIESVYVPHGVESAVYKPTDRTAARQALGTYLGRDLTNTFLVTTVAANKGTPSRKNFVSMIEAFALFVRGSSALGIAPHPNALFYLHTEPRGVWQGEDLRAVAAAFGVADRVLMPVQYHLVAGLFGPEFLNNVYNAADCFLLLSSEGFGIPTVEAQMAGCPVIVSDFSASPELCFGGWQVLGLRKFNPSTGVFWYEPVISDAARAISEAYTRRDDDSLRKAARAGALQYDADEVYERYMRPALLQIESELEGERLPGAKAARLNSLRSPDGLQEEDAFSSPERASQWVQPGALAPGTVRTLQLGCGLRPLPGAVNHDRTAHSPHVDIAHDLDILAWPFDSESFDQIIAFDVLEHLKIEVHDWLNECWRILTPGGVLKMRLPAHDNPVSFRDPTHRRVFTEETFDYFDPAKPLWRDYGSFYFADPSADPDLLPLARVQEKKSDGESYSPYADFSPLDSPSLAQREKGSGDEGLPAGQWWQIESVRRVNADPRYGVGDLEFTLRKRPNLALLPLARVQEKGSGDEGIALC